MGLFRLLLAISIIIAHSSPILGNTLVGGRVAVESFYILSGFYMGLVLTRKYQSHLTAFYRNRFLKLFPQYWFFLLLCLLVGFIFGTGLQVFRDFPLSPTSSGLLFFFNLSPIGQDLTNFLALNPHTGQLFFTSHFRDFQPEIWNFLILPQAWTISLELYFYLLAPWLNRQKTKVLLLICVLSLTARLIVLSSFHLNFDPWQYRFFPFELFFFVAGILSYRLYQKLQIKIHFIYLLPLFALLLLYPFVPHQTLKMLFFYGLVFATIPFLFRFTQNSKLDRILGEISYPLYLIHFLIINILAQILAVNHQWLGLLTTVISLPLAIAVYFFFQKPIDTLRRPLPNLS